MSRVHLHFASFALQLHDDLTLSYGRGPRISLLELGMNDLPSVLVPLARHACYAQACSGKRKDFKKNKGVFDYDLTMTLQRHSKMSFDVGWVYVDSR